MTLFFQNIRDKGIGNDKKGYLIKDKIWDYYNMKVMMLHQLLMNQ